MNDQEFQARSESALEALKRSLYDAESEADFEVEEAGGALQVNFDDPPARFVVSPNSPVRQIWISALATSFKLDWSDSVQSFLLPRTGETLKQLLSRLINEQLGGEEIELQ